MARSALVATLYRAPLWLHRLGIRGLERIVGIDWIVITTRGRHSGVPREVMLDVIGHDEATDTWYVQPADGRHANWFQNLLAPARRSGCTAAGPCPGCRPRGASGPTLIRTPPSADIIFWFVRYIDTIGRR
jgi:hypothetical protein